MGGPSLLSLVPLCFEPPCPLSPVVASAFSENVEVRLSPLFIEAAGDVVSGAGDGEDASPHDHMSCTTRLALQAV